MDQEEKCGIKRIESEHIFDVSAQVIDLSRIRSDWIDPRLWEGDLTFLQNSTYMDVFYREDFNDTEMEASPYLSAIYEMHRPKRHPWDEIVSFYNLTFDLVS